MSRNKMLNTIRSNTASLPKVPHPGIYSNEIADGHIWIFAEQVKKVGGFIFSFDEGLQAIQNLEKLFGEMKTVFSYKDTDFIRSNKSLTYQTKPHDCKDLDILMIKAELAVIENGAIWVTEPINFPRSALFLTQHLIVVVNSNTMVNDMHEAYAKIKSIPANFGVFISGPSKTADVEQCLVIGAHGPRSLTILMEDS